MNVLVYHWITVSTWITVKLKPFTPNISKTGHHETGNSNMIQNKGPTILFCINVSFCNSTSVIYLHKYYSPIWLTDRIETSWRF